MFEGDAHLVIRWVEELTRRDFSLQRPEQFS